MTPRLVLLFTGHRVDAPSRPAPRFPPWKVVAASAAIELLLDDLGAGPEDLALTQGAAGGDLIFSEACLRHGVPLHWLQPMAEDEFLRQSVLPSSDGEGWRERYQAVRPRLAAPPQALPPGAGDAFERTNLALLQQATAHGAERLRLLCLWDGSEGDGPGGTAHLVRQVQRLGGQMLRIDPAAL